MSTPREADHPSEQWMDAALEELKFHHDRIASGSDSVTQIAQYNFVLFGAALIAASKVPEVFGIIPLFWGAWLLHTIQRVHDSIKHEVYARFLEERINLALGENLLLWNVALTSKKSSSVGFSNYFYWMALDVASWITTIVILVRQEHLLATLGFCLAWLTIYGFAIRGFLSINAYPAECEMALRSCTVRP